LILAGIAAAVVGAIFLFRGGAPSPSTPAVGATPPAPPLPGTGKPDPKVPAKEEPPASPPKPPAPEVPTPAPTTDDEPAVDEAHLSSDDRQEIADAKKTILELIGSGSRISAEDLESEDTSLPEVKNADLPGAKAAVERSLALWKADKAEEVAARVPDALLAAIGRALSTPAPSVRMMLETTVYVPTRFASASTGKAVAMGSDWALVKYAITRANGATEAAVAVCVREGGAWRVFL
jgi:outer membrane biosynthesis protein TonB